MTETKKANTPGFNHHLAVFFSTDKNGRKLAHFVSRAGSRRAIRMPLADAELFVAAGQATEIPAPVKH